MSRVRVLRAALSDVDCIYDWLAARSPDGARAWYAAFLATAVKLGDDPFSFAVASESEHVGREVRQRFFKTRRGRMYRLLFVIVDDEVRVLRVRGPGQPLVRTEDLELS